MNNETHKIDRTGWPEGPWNTEPDRIDFIHAGFSCMMLRNFSGNWCGYVGVPNTHPFYEKSYQDVDVDVHGGLTYSDKCHGVICHVPEPGMPDDVWWLGFDCGHSMDYSPGIVQYSNLFDRGEYRDLNYVRNEVMRLAEQLRDQTN